VLNFSKLRNMRAVAVTTFLVLAAIASTPVQAQTYSVVHTFTNLPDGSGPYPLIQDEHGNLYGTTEWGGAICGGRGATCGTVYKVDSAGAETILYRFLGGDDGANPVAALVQDAAGNLYGTTRGNGAIPAHSTVFKVDPEGRETVLYVFDPSFQACCQDSPLALDEAGNLYGMSPYAGEPGCGVNQVGCGSLYEVTSSGTFRLLHIFKGTDGIRPEGGLVRDPKGNLYGTTLLGGDLSCESIGGPSGCGTVFKLGSDGKYTVLHTFSGHADGANPLGVIGGRDGNLYGIAGFGGDLNCYKGAGCGTIFRVDTKGKFSVLFTFTPDIMPQPSFAIHLLRDSEGNLYGVNQVGGANFSGFLFKIDPAREFTNLFSFPPTSQLQDGSMPMGVTRDSAGNFYGTMLLGGSLNNCEFGCGTVFKITF
jgi:uncharacterized repeat protein (TIGR03803 family)